MSGQGLGTGLRCLHPWTGQDTCLGPTQVEDSPVNALSKPLNVPSHNGSEQGYELLDICPCDVVEMGVSDALRGFTIFRYDYLLKRM